MKLVRRMFFLFLISSVPALCSFAGDQHQHNHAPGHCEWCEKNKQRGVVAPSKIPDLHASVPEERESSAITTISILAAVVLLVVSLGCKSMLSRREIREEEAQ